MLLRPVDQKALVLWVILFAFFFTGLFYFIPEWLIWVDLFISISISTYLVMLIDKLQATHGDRRISERSLFLMTFFGGSLGMVLAMYTLRHKSRKLSFQLVVWLLVLIQIGIVWYLIAPAPFGLNSLPIRANGIPIYTY